MDLVETFTGELNAKLRGMVRSFINIDTHVKGDLS